MSRTVLVVDDDPVVRILMSEYLTGQGYTVEVRESGKECLEYLSNQSPDVLLLDLIMPDISGIEVLKAIRNNPATNKLPIVMMSADTDTESLVRSNRVAADRYVNKPFGMQQITDALKGL